MKILTVGTIRKIFTQGLRIRLKQDKIIFSIHRKDRGCGMKEKIQLLAAALALILLLCSCAVRGTASNDAKPAAGDVTDSNAAPYEVPAFRDSVFNEDEATAFGSGEIDLSQLEDGIIGVKAQSDTRR